jgi:SNF2 family DNA or RNA helicase
MSSNNICVPVEERPCVPPEEHIIDTRENQPIVLSEERSPELLDKQMSHFDDFVSLSGILQKQYQRDGVRWCLEKELNPPLIQFSDKKGGFIADEMGLGKTIIMLGLIYTNFLKNTLIVLPAVLLSQWEKEIIRFTGHTPLIFYGKNKNCSKYY